MVEALGAFDFSSKPTITGRDEHVTFLQVIFANFARHSLCIVAKRKRGRQKPCGLYLPLLRADRLDRAYWLPEPLLVLFGSGAFWASPAMMSLMVGEPLVQTMDWISPLGSNL